MGSLGGLVAAGLLIVAAPVEAGPASDPVARWRPIVAEASDRFGIPIDWIDRVIRAESGGLTTLGGRPIRSKAGAIGLMQIMPATWTAMRACYRLGTDPDDPHDNIVAGTAFLRLMYDRFGYPGLFAAYNAGPSRYAAYLGGRSRLPAETVAYLGGVTGGRSAGIVTASTPPRELLFAIRRDLTEPDQPAPELAVNDGLFAIRKAAP